MQTPKPVVLLILDGWGHRAPAPDNAISLAHTPNWDGLIAHRPMGLLTTHGLAVGLPEGQMGNSEVGHMNIGAGRIVYQDLTRISKAIDEGDFQSNDVLVSATQNAKTQNSTLHILGLLSDGGVHSHESHLFATIELALAQGVPRIALHLFTDGRDVPPRCALSSIQKLEHYLVHPQVQVASVSGRYFAMDRDHRWERTEKAWRAISLAQATYCCSSAKAAVEEAYARGEDDEFIQPTVIGEGAPICAGDVGIFINFRSDRARQLTHALVDEDFEAFDQADGVPFSQFVTMTAYEQGLKVQVAFPPQTLDNVLGQAVAQAGRTQLRIAETEKYAHVTYFLNGGEETVFEGEDRVLIPSPKVATYDLQPQMSAPALSHELTDAIKAKKYDLIVANLANPDMVGHTGKLSAAVAAVEAVDQVIGEVLRALEAVGGEAIITADHGNAEQMLDADTGQAHTAHTTNPVPLIYVGNRPWTLAATGSLRDIAPTLLTLMDIPIPQEMTGQSLVDAEQA